MPNAEGREAGSWKGPLKPSQMGYHPFSDLLAESWQVDFIFLAEVLADSCLPCSSLKALE